MESFGDRKIKGVIAETIFELLFRDLGFFVMRLGQEHTVNPLTQLEKFVISCGGSFNLKRRIHSKERHPIHFISELPDFAIVDKNGDLHLVEVRFRERFIRDDGTLWDKDFNFFTNHENEIMFIISSDEDVSFSLGMCVSCERTENPDRFAYEIKGIPLKDFLVSLGFTGNDLVSAEERIEHYKALSKKWLLNDNGDGE